MIIKIKDAALLGECDVYMKVGTQKQYSFVGSTFGAATVEHPFRVPCGYTGAAYMRFVPQGVEVESCKEHCVHVRAGLLAIAYLAV